MDGRERNAVESWRRKCWTYKDMHLNKRAWEKGDEWKRERNAEDDKERQDKTRKEKQKDDYLGCRSLAEWPWDWLLAHLSNPRVQAAAAASSCWPTAMRYSFGSCSPLSVLHLATSHRKAHLMNVSAISTIAPKHSRCTETIAGFPYSLPNNKTLRLPGRGHNSLIFENEASQMRGQTHIKLCSEDLKEERSLGAGGKKIQC